MDCGVITHPEFPCPREELSVFVKADCHHPVCGIERFFDAVSMVYIDVDIQDAVMIPTATFELRSSRGIMPLTSVVRGFRVRCLYSRE